MSAVQFDLFEQREEPGAWELPHKGDAMPVASIEVEPVAEGWAYGASWWHHKRMCGGGFGTKGGRVAPTRREAIESAAAWLDARLADLPDHRAKVARWAEGVLA
jgi:hypothetical protein